ncbi:MAG TPA: nucleotidyltransferase domain-containing protein [Coleofasciculaceae cyanobacterium]
MPIGIEIESQLKIMLQEFREALESLYGDRFIQLILYGSHARHEATEDSDIDVMVVLRGTVSPATEILRMGKIKTDLNLKYDELLSVVPISEVDFQQKITPFTENVRREGIAV